MDITDSPINSSRSPVREIPAVGSLNENGSILNPITANSTASNGNGGSLFVGKLAYDCRPRELEELFGKYGRITRCDIKRGTLTFLIFFRGSFMIFFRLRIC